MKVWGWGAVALAVGLGCVPAWGEETKTDEIVVTATPITNSDAAPARPAARIEREEIWRSGGTSLADALAQMPGVTQSSFAVGASRPVIRGLDNFRVRVQEHGIGSHDVSAVSEDHGVPLDPLSSTAIEIVRGPATLRYGSGAIGGVVTTLNNRIPRFAPDQLLTGEAYGSFSTVDSGYEGGVLLDGGMNGVAVHADAFTRTTEDYDIPIAPGTQTFTRSEAWGAAGGVSAVGDWGFFGASFARFESDYDIPAPEDPDEFLGIDLEQTRIRVGGELDDPLEGIESVRLDGGYSDYQHKEIEGGVDVGSIFDLNEFEARMEIEHSHIGIVHGAFGLQGGTREISAAGEGGELLAPTDSHNFAAFVFEEIDLSDRTVIELAGRIEHVSHKGTAIDSMGNEFGADLGFWPWGVSAALVHDLDQGWSVALSGQLVERAPDILELFAKGPHEATETFEIGNPGLEKEKARSIELRLVREGEGLRVNASAFFTHFDGFIARTLTGVECNEEFDTCGMADPMEEVLDQLVYIQRDANFWGGEFVASAPVVKFLDAVVRLEGRLDFVRAEFTGGGDLPRIPPLRYGGALEIENERGLFGRISLLRVTRQDHIAANETETAGYSLLDAEIAQRLNFAGINLDFAILGRNLLDDTVRNHVSFKKADVVLPGRSVRFVVRTAF